MILILVLAVLSGLTLKTIGNANAREMKYEAFNLPVPLNISEEDMKVNLSTFVRHHGKLLRSRYSYAEDVQENSMKLKVLELMKQAIYAAQDRIKHLEMILDKYTGDATFRMGFIFMKLDQLLEDLKRIYSIAVSEREVRNRHQIMYYEHAAKKNIDITYIVEYLISLHTRIYHAVEKINKDSDINKDLDLDFH